MNTFDKHSPSDQDFSLNFEDISKMNYRLMVMIDPTTGYARDIQGTSRYLTGFDPEHFHYDTAMSQALRHYCQEESAADTIERMKLEEVCKALSRMECYEVFYTVIGDNHELSYKKSIYYKTRRGQILHFIQDIGNATMSVHSANVELREKLLKESQKTSMVNRMLNLLSRDMRTGLFSLMGLTDSILLEGHELQKNTDALDEIDRMIEKLYLTGKFMMDTLSDITELQDACSDPSPVPFTAISISEMFDFLEEPVAEIFQYSDTLFDWNVDGIHHPVIYSDAHTLKDFFLRLFRYMVSISAPGGCIHVKVREQEISENSSMYYFQVHTDNCTWTIDDFKRNITEYPGIFHEIHGDPDQIDYNLILMHRYLEILGGEFTLVHDDEWGHSVDISLRFDHSPVRDSASAVEEKEAAGSSLADINRRMVHLHPGAKDQEMIEIPDLSGKSALVIDDNIINLEVEVRLLQNTGLSVTSADDGITGLERFMAEKGNFDIVILDIRMPGMNGIEVARKIRSLDGPVGQVPIIALSSDDKMRDVEHSLEAGINEHLIKPVGPPEFYRVLEKYL